MPVKIFSHQADPDGIGCIILSKICFDEVDYTLCKNITDLDIKLDSFINSKEYLNYEKIFITDLCPSVNLLDKIVSNEIIDKVVIIDHHVFNLEKIQDKDYAFINIDLKECAMSLFYEYLRKTGNLILPNKVLKEFVLLTKLHDTWEWKTTNNLDAYHLETLFHKLGAIGYLNHFLDKLNMVAIHFKYSEEEKKLINEQLKDEEDYLNNLTKRLIYKKIANIKYGIVYGLYNYRNILSEKLRESNNCDILIYIAVDNETISFRSISGKISALEVALEYHGGGHEQSASCNLNPENEHKIIKKYLS